MNTNDIIGSIGVSLMLIAYLLNTLNLIKNEGNLFFVLNIIGAATACYASYLIQYTPFVILEAVWTFVSIVGLLKNYKANIR